ncbi:MAG: transposase [Nitrososphaeraceae archaeon]
MISGATGDDSSYSIPDIVWDRQNHCIALLPSPSSIHWNRKKTGRPRMDDRTAMSAIFYIFRTGCQWKALPRSLGATSTVHDR